MWLTITIVAAFFAALEITARVWKRDDAHAPGPAERLLYAMAIGTLLWLASVWLLSLGHLLRHPLVVARTLLFVLAAMPGIMRCGRALAAHSPSFDTRALVVPLISAAPLVIWLAFVLWRGALVPVLNHDALSYHLPKAAFYVRDGGFETLAELEFLIALKASNYELLLADAIALDGVDDVTEWISTWLYLLFVVATVALAERWWRPHLRASMVVVLVTAGVPLLLLHSGAHKNDVMLAAFAVVAFTAAGRFLVTRELAAFWIAIASLIAGAGTKTHGLLIAACVAPLLAWPLLRPFSSRRLLLALGITIATAVLLGGADYAERFAATNAERGSAASDAPKAVAIAEYGDWANLWRGPYVLLAAPFAPSPWSLRVPWEPRPIFWRRYEIFFSELGIPFAVAAVLMPFAMFLLRRREHARERLAVTAAAICAFIVLLPVHYEPAGLYLIYMPRFVLFIVPLVFAWTIAPAVRALTGRRGAAALAAAAIVFAVYAGDMATDDVFVPIDYVLWAREDPGRRIIPFDPNRGTSIVDRIAGPRDRVLIDAGRSAWIYPAFGQHLTRDVRILRPSNGPVVVADDVDWVVVERAWNTIWGHPALRNIADATRYIARGNATDEDLRVLRAMEADPRFESIYVNVKTAQAVFRRKR